MQSFDSNPSFGSNSGRSAFNADLLARPEELGLPEYLRVTGKISQGGMGIVYKAVRVNTNEPLAVKVLLPKQASERRDILRFKREAQVISTLSSRYIVKIRDFGSTKHGIPFLVMDYIEGVTLTELPSLKLITMDEAVSIFVQIAEALNHAHGRGIVHRDLKPSNVMVSPEANGSVTCKVVDFGIAQLAQDDDDATLVNLTGDGTPVGTPSYMSPEQMAGEQVDNRSDIYSLGCVMFYLLTGQPPFKGETPIQVLAHRSADPLAPEITTLRKDVPRALAAIIDKCLEHRRDDRYKVCDELLEELSSYREKAKIPTRLSGRKRVAIKKYLVLVGIVLVTFAIGFGIFTAMSLMGKH